MELIEKLKSLDRIPMHMPGHKRNVDLEKYLMRLSADLDITEIDGWDDLHCAEGILKESMDLAAKMRGMKRAFYLVNGATCGILASVCAMVQRGEKVICMRNCHKSVYNAIEISGAETVFVSPKCDETYGFCLSAETDKIVDAIENNPDAKLIIITSPTYEGAVSDIEALCSAAHEKNIPVLVDAAHGAHFGYNSGFPKDASACGADIVVESLHKTMASLTQTAVCYVKKDEYADKIEEMLGIFETSSPSYLLMASIDSCIHLIKNRGTELFKEWEKNLEWFYENIKDLKNLKVFDNSGNEFYDFDRSKIVILCSSGTKLACRLRDLGIECEMASVRYVIAMTGIGDVRDNLKALADALKKLDAEFEKPSGEIGIYAKNTEKILPASKLESLEKEYADIELSLGRICAEYVWAYPPGVPILIPGERISFDEKNVMMRYEADGIELKGRLKRKKGKILVLKEDFT